MFNISEDENIALLLSTLSIPHSSQVVINYDPNNQRWLKPMLFVGTIY